MVERAPVDRATLHVRVPDRNGRRWTSWRSTTGSARPASRGRSSHSSCAAARSICSRAYVERTQLEPSGAAITDRLTTLHTRPLFDAVLAKEVERAARFGYPLSLILFDVDHLSAINQEHGYGVGDKILERLGILMRTYFRQHDWVARHSDDSIAVLLSRTDADHASELAERVRSTVEERLGFVDHLTDRPVTVSVSAAIINLTIALGDVIDTERLMADAEAAVERAKRQGRNRVERIDGYSGHAAGRARLPNRTLPRSSPSASPPPPDRRASSCRRAPCLPRCRAAAAA